MGATWPLDPEVSDSWIWQQWAESIPQESKLTFPFSLENVSHKLGRYENIFDIFLILFTLSNHLCIIKWVYPKEYRKGKGHRKAKEKKKKTERDTYMRKFSGLQVHVMRKELEPWECSTEIKRKDFWAKNWGKEKHICSSVLLTWTWPGKQNCEKCPDAHT